MRVDRRRVHRVGCEERTRPSRIFLARQRRSASRDARQRGSKRTSTCVQFPIVRVNHRVIFAPDILEEALKGAGASFTVTVLGVKFGKKSQV